jgi:carboxymethylenebutenolidase
VIVHDIWGANDFYRDLARRLAGEGFAVLLPDLFFRQGPLPEQTREQAFTRRAKMDQQLAVDDLAAAVTWLSTHDACSGAVGLVGFCMGGTFVFLAAARDLDLSAVVAYYGFPAGTEGWPLKPLDEADRVRLPLLAFWGDQDAGVGMDNVQRYDDALTGAGAEHEFVIYPGLPHGFLTFDGGSPHFAEAQDSYRRMVAFFRSQLAA